ncbi:MAG: hypothetical protein EOO27_04840 [Comamonadaceae bacterium]|nr:MAG: hypothetical protein EOO27_04840 [Comamonadaceae bacterium]
MDTSDTWVRFYQPAATELARDETTPAWLRIVLLTMAHAARNGHANWQPGELARAVGKVDPDGVAQPLKNPGREIQRAARKGYLDPKSRPRCTVMHPGVMRGPHGNPDAQCSVHD